MNFCQKKKRKEKSEWNQSKKLVSQVFIINTQILH